MRYLFSFEDKEALEPEIVGNKFSSMAYLHRQGFLVPTSWCLSTKAHDYYRKHNQIPQQAIGEIDQALSGFDFQKGLAVRSSGILEDTQNFSLAGQYTTFLNIKTREALFKSIEDCWLKSEDQSINFYLSNRGHKGSLPLLAIILQKMILPVYSGVAFSRKPFGMADKEMVIEYVQGLGNKLVSGEVSPQRAFVDLEGGIKKTETQESEPDSQFLEQVAKNLGQIRELYAGEVDMEWAIDDKNRLWVLQARPISTSVQNEQSIPEGAWSRKIAEDLWADKVSPFLASVLEMNRRSFDLSNIFKILNIDVPQPTLKVIRGYLYINCQCLELLFQFLPSKFWNKDIEEFFPPGYEFKQLSKRSFSDMILLTPRLVILFFRQPKANPLICLIMTRFWFKKIEKVLKKIEQYPERELNQVWAKIKKLLETLKLMQRKNQWPYLYATLFTWLLKWWITELQKRPQDSFLQVISHKKYKNNTVTMQKEFNSIVANIKNDPQWCQKFQTSSGEELYQNLPSWLDHLIKDFLNRYGFRSKGRTLLNKRWQESPIDFIKMLKNSLYEEQDYRSIRQDISTGEENLSVRILSSISRQFLDIREDLRFHLDRLLFDLRQSLISAGNLLGIGQRIFFLHFKEIDDLIGGKIQKSYALQLAQERAEIFYREEVPYSYYDQGLPKERYSSPGDIFQGVGTSPGRVKGKVRILSSPEERSIQKGDIIVTTLADPGLSTVLGYSSALVAEEGGLLNHCSIVARELNIPAVVGIKRITHLLQEGQEIIVDGSQGLVITNPK